MAAGCDGIVMVNIRCPGTVLNKFRRLVCWPSPCSAASAKVSLLMVCALGAAGCVLPESVVFVDDTAPNYPPTVTATDPLLTTQVPIPNGPNGREFTLTIQDRNLDDQLHVRMFVDLYVTPGGVTASYVQGALAP